MMKTSKAKQAKVIKSFYDLGMTRHDLGNYDPGDIWSEYGRLEKNEKTGEFLVPDVMSGSNYSGSSVERSNHKVFLESFGNVPGVVNVSGGHGTYAIALHVPEIATHELADEILETLQELQNYPVIDEEAMTALELEEDTEAWDNWARSDFKSALHTRYGIDFSEVSDDAILEVFRKACDTGNHYWENDGPNRYIRVEEVAKDCALEELRKLGGIVEDEDSEDVRTTAERKDLEEKLTPQLVRGYRNGGHWLEFHPRGVGNWTPRHGHPAASVTQCRTCKRTGWINVHPVEGAPDHGGPIFKAHCKTGKDPKTHCADCAEPYEGLPGRIGEKVCDNRAHAKLDISAT